MSDFIDVLLHRVEVDGGNRYQARCFLRKVMEAIGFTGWCQFVTASLSLRKVFKSVKISFDFPVNSC